jgi:hypothetical protein
MKKPLVLLLHLAYWFAYLMLITIVFLALNPMKGGPHALRMFSSFFGFLLVAPPLASFYLGYFVLHPRLLQRGKTGKLILASLGVVVGVSLLSGWAMLAHLDQRAQMAQASEELLGNVLFFMILCTIHLVLSLVVRGFVVSVNDIRVKQELQRRNTEMELALVKSQLSPHFLFNTLNNIDVLIERDPPTASAYLRQLSDLLRFMLYDSQADHLPLASELEWVRKYIDLQRIRSANPDFVKFTLQGDPSRISIAPMTLIPFVENAFKHCHPPKEGHGIKLVVTATESQLSFSCENVISQGTKPLSSEPGGLGLALVQRRLQLLYGDRHTLVLSQTGDRFKALLTLAL